MVVKEYGKRGAPAILMLHGGGLSWWNHRSEAEILAQCHHVVLPVLDGHAQSDVPFLSIEDNAARILGYVRENLGGHVLALCGLSLGAQIAVEMLAQDPSICDYAMIESVSLVPSKMLGRWIPSTFSMSYGLIGKRWFSKLQFQSLHMHPSFFGDYYRDSSAISKDNLISFMKASVSYSPKASVSDTKAKVRIVVGEREQRKMKKSAELLQNALEGSCLEIKEGLFHGEYSLSHPEEYVKELLEFLEK